MSTNFTFLRQKRYFSRVPPDFRNFYTPRKGRNTDVTGTKDSKISKKLGKTMKIVSKKLNLPPLRKVYRRKQLSAFRPTGPSQAEQFLKEEIQ